MCLGIYDFVCEGGIYVDDKFIATKSSDTVCFPKIILQYVCNTDKNKITTVMPIVVIDLFEII